MTRPSYAQVCDVVTSKAVVSPCINVCQINPETGLCLGCMRTLDEIACWLDFSDARKREVLAQIAARS
ncbi:MAG: DUF1289 domain-containing protein [Burkholderiales bacterium]